MSDQAFDALHRELDSAEQVSGVTRELVLLRAFNRGFERFATLEGDWQRAGALDYTHWRKEVARLLEWLEFQLESADCYASEPTGLAARVGALRQGVEATTARIESLREQAEQLAEGLESLTKDRVRCEREVETLQTLAELLPWREAVLQALGEEHLRALADEGLAAAAVPVRAEVERGLREAREQLEAAERQLAEGLSLREQDWKRLHDRMNHIPRPSP